MNTATVHKSQEKLLDHIKKHSQNLSEHNAHDALLEDAILTLANQANAVVNVEAVTAYWGSFNGEYEDRHVFAEKLLKRYLSSEEVSQKNNDLILVSAAEKGQWRSIKYLLTAQELNFSDKSTLKALNIAVKGSKPGTTRSLVENSDCYDTDTLITLYMAHASNSDVRSTLCQKIDSRIEGGFKTHADFSKAIQKAPNDAVHKFYSDQFKKRLKNKWDLADSHEIATQTNVFDTTLTKIFNFKANTVTIINKPKNENSFIDTYSFRNFENKTEIESAYEVLKILSSTPPIYQKNEKGAQIKLSPLKTLG